MRINKYLALSGLGSRRKCEEYIKSGIVKINGNVVRDLSSQINNTDLVTVKNKLITIETHKIYYLLNKPKGYICSTKDPYSRKTIYDLIPNKDRIFSAGRLDYDTSGLIILTNDGDFSNEGIAQRINADFSNKKNYFLRKPVSEMYRLLSQFPV